MTVASNSLNKEIIMKLTCNINPFDEPGENHLLRVDIESVLRGGCFDETVWQVIILHVVNCKLCAARVNRVMIELQEMNNPKNHPDRLFSKVL